MALHHLLHGNVSNENPVFKVEFEGGVGQLDPSLTINTVTVTPEFRYKATDASIASWPAWDYGPTCAQASSGTDPTVGLFSPLQSVNDGAMRYNGGDVHQDSGTTEGDVGTDDMVIEIVFEAHNNTQMWFSKGAAAGVRYRCFSQLSDSSMVFGFNDGTASENIICAALDHGAWYHGMCFVNRDEASTNGAQWYINGVASGSPIDPSSAQNTLDVVESLTLGATSDFGNKMNGGALSYVAMWKQASWHQAGASGPTEWATIAAERFAKLTGVYASVGTDQVPTFTRAEVAPLGTDNGYFVVGDNWPVVTASGLTLRSEYNDSELEYDYVATASGSFVSVINTLDEDTAAEGFMMSANDHATLELLELTITSADVAEFAVTNTSLQARQTGTTDISDGLDHTVAGSWVLNDVRLFVDSSEDVAADAAATIPPTTLLHIGADRTGTNHFPGAIRSAKIYQKEKVKK